MFSIFCCFSITTTTLKKFNTLTLLTNNFMLVKTNIFMLLLLHARSFGYPTFSIVYPNYWFWKVSNSRTYRSLNCLIFIKIRKNAIANIWFGSFICKIQTELSIFFRFSFLNIQLRSNSEVTKNNSEKIMLIIVIWCK